MEVSRKVPDWAKTLVGRARSSAAARTMRFIDIRRIRLSFVFYLKGVSGC
jgi:hypothetical protein